jgi:LuxR family maltose regulon positive regulatory protein
VLIDALSYVVEGDPERAEPLLARAVDVAVDAGAAAVPAASVALSERALLAMGRKDWRAFDTYAAQALSQVHTGHLEGYSDSALPYAVSAGAALHRGDVEATHEHLTDAARLRPVLTHANPLVSVQALLEMARVYLALSDSAGAREVLRQARDILRRCGDLGVLANQIDELTSKLDTMRTVRVGASSLTAAELRLVPFLSTYLTFPQIAERLFVSRNTIKSQAISIYQKLGVSSRGEAIEQLQEIGLLEG